MRAKFVFKTHCMIKRKKLWAVLFVIFFLFIFFNFVTASDYGLKETVNQGKLNDAFSVSSVDAGASSFISSRLGILIGSILSFIGVIFMLLIIYGGIMWMTSRGNDQQVEKSRDLIVQAVIGLVIVLASYAITAFIGEQLTGANSTTPPSSLLLDIKDFYC